MRPSIHLYSEPPRKKSGGIYRFLTVLLLASLGLIWWRRNHPESNPQDVSNQHVIATNAIPKPQDSANVSNRLALASRDSTNRLASFSEAVLGAQIALDRIGISPGSLDGVAGGQTRAAICAFQRQQNLRVSGELDPDTLPRLAANAPPKISYLITSNDLSRLQPLSATWSGKSRQSSLDYESILELIAEKSHSHPNLIRRLNPEIVWTNATAGALVQIPNTERPAPHAHAVLVRISLGDKTLEAFDAATNLIAHFPCSIAAHVEKRPVGNLHVQNVALNPNYTFDPKIFPESAEARELTGSLILPPGPNNPVGTAWIGLDVKGYGIHGTPSPENVGRTESHGCFRLANWNAEYLAKLVAPGTPVVVEP